MKRKTIIITLAIILITIAALMFRTGFLQESKIDNRDLNTWKYNSNQEIENTQGFTIPGSNETCWYLIHGYTSTPAEMKELAQALNTKFNETVVVTKLKGHGEIPSQILNLSLNEWYNQVYQETTILSETCENTNIVGLSFGGTLSTRLAEEKTLNNVYLIAPYFETPYKFYYGLKPATYLETFGPIILYSKKRQIAQINSKEGLSKHIAYWNMPFAPVLNSKEFIQKTRQNINKIEEPLLVQHSINDKTSNVKTSIEIINKTSSKTKQLITFEKSNHILLADFDKDQVIQNIILFEETQRKINLT